MTEPEVIALVTQDGLPYDISLTTARQWQWFEPILQGRFTAQDSYQVPFSGEELDLWLSIPEPPAQSAPLDYYEILPLIDFFGPTTDNWLYYVTPESMPLQERKEWYLKLGRHIREEGLVWPWRDVVTSAPVHENFFVAYDPVYTNYKKGSEVMYKQRITQEQKSTAVRLDELSVVTGVLHISWLKSGHKDTREEVPWNAIDWCVIGTLERPNILIEPYKERYQVDEMEREVALEMITFAYDRGTRYMTPIYKRSLLTYAQRALALAACDEADQVTAGQQRSIWDLTSRTMGNYVKELSLRLEYYTQDGKKLPPPKPLDRSGYGGVAKLVTNVPEALELYGVLLAQLASDITSGAMDPEQVDYKEALSRGLDSSPTLEAAYGPQLLALTGVLPLFLTQRQLDSTERYSAPMSEMSLVDEAHKRERLLQVLYANNSVMMLVGMVTRLVLARGRMTDGRPTTAVTPKDYASIV